MFKSIIIAEFVLKSLTLYWIFGSDLIYENMFIINMLNIVYTFVNKMLIINDSVTTEIIKFYFLKFEKSFEFTWLIASKEGMYPL